MKPSVEGDGPKVLAQLACQSLIARGTLMTTSPPVCEERIVEELLDEVRRRGGPHHVRHVTDAWEARLCE